VTGVSDLLRAVDGGRVLDVATGKGAFVRSLIEDLRSYTQILGLDSSDAGAAPFADAFGGNPAIRFVLADATAMPFGDDSFDTVAMVGSLHHVEDPQRVLAEMFRVLRPGGVCIVGEQMRDRLTRAETTHRLFHEWSEEVLGVAFRKTYLRRDIVELVAAVGLEGGRQIVERDDSDPLDAAKIERWQRLTTDLIGRAWEAGALAARGQSIRARLPEVGIRISPALFLVGRKPR
jgi:SAM-dependent methyltransferase